MFNSVYARFQGHCGLGKLVDRVGLAFKDVRVEQGASCFKFLWMYLAARLVASQS